MRINAPAVSHQSIDGEVVVINLETGIYYSLLALGACVWERFAAGVPEEEIAAEVSAYYADSEAAGAVRTLFASLREEQLITDGATARADGPQAPLPEVFAVPVLERFSDMQELLLLDPIHEVDQVGWPHKPAES